MSEAGATRSIADLPGPSRPEIQTRWAQEAQAVLGEQPYPAGHEIVESLDYGEAVLRESMRRNLAFLESKTAMAMIARNFEVELDESRGPVKEQLNFTMVPHGLHLRLRERVAGSPMPVGAGA